MSIRLLTVAILINLLSLVMTLSVVIVVVTFGMSLATGTWIPGSNHPPSTSQLTAPSQDPFADLPFSPLGDELVDIRGSSDEEHDSSRLESNQGQETPDQGLLPDSGPFFQILYLSGLFILSSFSGLLAAHKSSKTGSIVCHWFFLTVTLLISTWVTSEFFEYENLFDWETTPPSAQILTQEVLARMLVLIGSLQMLSSVIVTIAKLQKTRVAAKIPSIENLIRFNSQSTIAAAVAAATHNPPHNLYPNRVLAHQLNQGLPHQPLVLGGQMNGPNMNGPFPGALNVNRNLPHVPNLPPIAMGMHHLPPSVTLVHRSRQEEDADETLESELLSSRPT